MNESHRERVRCQLLRVQAQLPWSSFLSLLSVCFHVLKVELILFEEWYKFRLLKVQNSNYRDLSRKPAINLTQGTIIQRWKKGRARQQREECKPWAGATCSHGWCSQFTMVELQSQNEMTQNLKSGESNLVHSIATNVSLCLEVYRLPVHLLYKAKIGWWMHGLVWVSNWEILCKAINSKWICSRGRIWKQTEQQMQEAFLRKPAWVLRSRKSLLSWSRVSLGWLLHVWMSGCATAWERKQFFPSLLLG